MIRVGVIGYGYWGPNLVRNFSEVPGYRVAAICDLRAERLADPSVCCDSIKKTTNASDLFRDQSVDAVVIATPVSSHFSLGMQALNAGKHVLIEKPMTATVEQGERLIEAAARRRLILMVDHTFVYSGAVRKIRELVATEELGQLYYYDSVRVNLGLFRHDFDVLWDLAVHDLSIMDYVLDTRPVAVAAIAMAHVPGQLHDVAYLTCFFEAKLIAHFHVNWLAPVKIRRTLIGGERRMVVYDDLEVSEKIKVYDKGITLNNSRDEQYQLMVGYRTGDMWAPKLDPTEALRQEAYHFLQCVEQGQQPLTDGEAGLRVVRILEAAAQSVTNRGRPLEINCRAGRKTVCSP